VTARRPVLLLLLALTPALAGCWHDGDPDAGPTPATGTPPTEPPPPGAKLTFGGVVVDARTGAPLADATVRLDLAQARACRREGVLWNSYALAVDAEGRYGPLELPYPRSDEVAFFLHAEAPGHTENVTFVGPAEARAGTRNVTVVLHPEAALEGRAPPGTLVALAAPGFPRFAVADAEGAFRLEGARVVEAAWAANTEPPSSGRVAPPATLDLADGNETTWRLEGVAKDANGAPQAVDVVAWNGTALASAGRSNAAGVFVLPLAGRPQELLLEARTGDGRLGGTLRVPVEGPPALRQTLLVRPLC
jgi:hypothetical protein